MALARCDKCGSPQPPLQSYPHLHAVLSDHQIMCGSTKCLRRDANIWLTNEEEERYLHGVRAFRVSGVVDMVQVK